MEKLIYRATARLVMLPASHLLSKHVSSMARRYVKKNCSPLHELIHTSHMCPDNYETISLIRRGPKWIPSIQVNILAMKIQAVKEAEEVMNDIKVFSEGLCIEGMVGAAAVLFRRGVEVK